MLYIRELKSEKKELIKKLGDEIAYNKERDKEEARILDGLKDLIRDVSQKLVRL